MHTFLNHVGRVFKGLKQELETFTCIGILNFVYEYHGEEFLAVVQVAEVFVLLDENLVVEDDFYLVETLGNVIALLLTEWPIFYKGITVLNQGQFQLTHWPFQQGQNHPQHVQFLKILLTFVPSLFFI